MDDSKASETSQHAELTAQLLTEDLGAIGSVSWAPRLDGYALFEDGVMFGFVAQDCTPYLRANAASAARFHDMGSTKHAEMPYWSVPRSAIADVGLLRELAYESADAAHIAASFGIDDDPIVITKPSMSIAAAITRTLLAA